MENGEWKMGRRVRPGPILHFLFSILAFYVVSQLSDPRDHVQDRLLWTGAVRKDDQPALHLRTGARGSKGQDGLARDADRSYALLRLPPARSGNDLGLLDAFSAL